jgi:hypothetical protein
VRCSKIDPTLTDIDLTMDPGRLAELGMKFD